MNLQIINNGMPMSPKEGNIGIMGTLTVGYRWCGILVVVTGFTGAACRVGRVTVVP